VGVSNDRTCGVSLGGRDSYEDEDAAHRPVLRWSAVTRAHQPFTPFAPARAATIARYRRRMSVPAFHRIPLSAEHCQSRISIIATSPSTKR
jgi:hypothetical protein